MSDRKLAGSRQRSHTVIPRPPYRSHAGSLGSVHRLTICFQILYQRLLEPPCVLFMFPRVSRYRHPQDFVSPHRSSCIVAVVVFPQSQLHITHLRVPRRSASSVTTNRPNRSPLASIRRITFSLSTPPRARLAAGGSACRLRRTSRRCPSPCHVSPEPPTRRGFWRPIGRA